MRDSTTRNIGCMTGSWGSLGVIEAYFGGERACQDARGDDDEGGPPQRGQQRPQQQQRPGLGGSILRGVLSGKIPGT